MGQPMVPGGRGVAGGPRGCGLAALEGCSGTVPPARPPSHPRRDPHPHVPIRGASLGGSTHAVPSRKVFDGGTTRHVALPRSLKGSHQTSSPKKALYRKTPLPTQKRRFRTKRIHVTHTYRFPPPLRVTCMETIHEISHEFPRGTFYTNTFHLQIHPSLCKPSLRGGSPSPPHPCRCPSMQTTCLIPCESHPIAILANACSPPRGSSHMQRCPTTAEASSSPSSTTLSLTKTDSSYRLWHGWVCYDRPLPPCNDTIKDVICRRWFHGGIGCPSTPRGHPCTGRSPHTPVSQCRVTSR